ncbi:MAG: 2TM domain-containing protein [Bacteroidota bacterium]
MEQKDTENKYIRAKQRVAELKGFYAHITAYIVVMVVLAVINYLTNEFRYAWFLWAAFGWGIGVFFHAVATFDLNPFFGKKWEQRKINEILEEENQTGKWK